MICCRSRPCLSSSLQTLTKALEAALPGMTQPVFTLERDEETIWPELAKQHAAQMVAVQPQGCVR